MIAVNVVVLAGTIAAEPVELIAGDGTPTTELRLRAPSTDDAKGQLPLPVVVGGHRLGFSKGHDVLVTGRLVRRFYRSGAGARSLTEVRATTIRLLTPGEVEGRILEAVESDD